MSVHGECTLLQIVDITAIQSGRAYAALQGLIREGCAVRAQRDGHARFTITNAGRETVESWNLTPKETEIGRV
ncbi:hypothetical protein [Streptomyces sp. NPDC088360]|uniref:hypothetical protein n=1 Tax=Streptomyces sp. NPDC088360 TaxID=3154515 RepID=UPI00344F2138